MAFVTMNVLNAFESKTINQLHNRPFACFQSTHNCMQFVLLVHTVIYSNGYNSLKYSNNWPKYGFKSRLGLLLNLSPPSKQVSLIS